MKKRIHAFLLAVVMLFTLVVPTFAQSITLAASTTAVKAGEDVTVTVSFDEDLADVSGLQMLLHFNSDLFTFKSAEEFDTSAYVIQNAKGTDPDRYMVINWASLRGKGTIKAGKYVACTFTAKENIADASTAEFTAEVNMEETSMAPGAADPVYDNSILSVTVTPAAPAVEGYAVAASAVNPSVTVNEDAQVALRVTNSDAAAYNAYYMEVSYDSAKLTYKSINTDVSVTDNGGVLKIAGYGADRTCGTDNIVLTFTAKATGEAKVAVTSAKVDAKANAVEKDAPAATITTDEATITVGGYQVTLPDAFTGAAAATPGESYTFTAKDTSRKYDFTGSTMNGEAVTVIDNGDGIYTIENVTGALVIIAEEKAAMVTINLTNNTAATVSGLADGQQVEPDVALNFMAIDMSGKELVVTINGETLAPAGSQMGRYTYTIPAEKVTGDVLNVVISYKAEDKATIVETGDWTDVTNRGGWTQSGDQVAAGTNLNFTMTQQEGYTYTVTVNGTALTGQSRQGTNFYTYTIDGATYVKAGETTTISITKTAAQPAYTVTVSEYLKLDGRSVFLITAVGDVAEGKLLAYDGNAMYWSEKYNDGKGAYVWLVSSDKALAEVQAEETAAKLTVIDANETNKVSVSYNGDVNLTGTADINDAQLVWNMYNAEYKADTDFQTVNRLKYLSADMNGDGKLDTTDAAAIVAALINQ